MYKLGLLTNGGPVQAGGGVYIRRAADDQLTQLCRDSSFAYVLSARQVGKTSLVFATKAVLTDEGIHCAWVDFTGIADPVAENCYRSLAGKIARDLVPEFDLGKWWDAPGNLKGVARLLAFFRDVLVPSLSGGIVIFLDEIDFVTERSYSDDLFAALRSLYNERAEQTELKRLSFVLIGAVRQSDLIRDRRRTPFNVGRSVEVTDFTAEECAPLADAFGFAPAHSLEILGWILKWTGGHPYLTQTLCREVSLVEKEHWTESEVDDLVAEKFFTPRDLDINLQTTRDALTVRIPGRYRAAVLTMYRRILKGDTVLDEEQNVAKSYLKIAGVVRRVNGELHLRNPIYGRVLDRAWVDEHMPVQWKPYVAALATLAMLGGGWISWTFTDYYQIREVLKNAPVAQASETANKIGSNRDEVIDWIGVTTAIGREDLSLAALDTLRHYKSPFSPTPNPLIPGEVTRAIVLGKLGHMEQSDRLLNIAMEEINEDPKWNGAPWGQVVARFEAGGDRDAAEKVARAAAGACSHADDCLLEFMTYAGRTTNKPMARAVIDAFTSRLPTSSVLNIKQIALTYNANGWWQFLASTGEHPFAEIASGKLKEAEMALNTTDDRTDFLRYLIAREYATAGDLANAERVILAATKYRPAGLSLLAPLANRGGHSAAHALLSEAIDLSEAIENDDWRSISWSNAARAAARIGEFRTARLTADRCSRSADRLAAYAVILAEYYKRKRPDLVPVLEAVIPDPLK